MVYAVRTISAATHRQVELVGWSQGTSTLTRWAIRWWPDVRPLIASLVGLAPLNNIGSLVANAACAPGSCVPAAWQQAVGAHFMASPTAYAIAIEALEHPGHPADLSAVHVSQPCLPGTMPGVTPAAFLSGEAGVAGRIAQRLESGKVSSEPQLRCYVTASCRRRS